MNCFSPSGRRRMIVGISGATGMIRLPEVLRELDVETHLVVTKAGERTLAYEADLTSREPRQLADHVYPDADIGAAIASGSFRIMGMIVAPCSVNSLSAIAYSTTDGLENGAIVFPPVPRLLRSTHQPEIGEKLLPQPLQSLDLSQGAGSREDIH